MSNSIGVVADVADSTLGLLEIMTGFIGSVVSSWRNEASNFKIKKKEIDRMSSAFEHEDLQKAKY